MKTHRGTKTKLYSIWHSMKRRCLSPTNCNFERYGARGITVCERWMHFENFRADMGDPPAGMSLERRDNSKGYSPDNCTWATPSQQARNRRNNRLVEIDGVTKPLSQWCEDLNVDFALIAHRLRGGKSIQEALTAPRFLTVRTKNPTLQRVPPAGFVVKKPESSEVLAEREKLFRSFKQGPIFQTLTHCMRGHEFTPENAHIDSRGHKQCIACRTLRYEFRNAKRRADTATKLMAAEAGQ